VDFAKEQPVRVRRVDIDLTQLDARVAGRSLVGRAVDAGHDVMTCSLSSAGSLRGNRDP
jgi:hypothetical protein